jgi:hypothetical protein
MVSIQDTRRAGAMSALRPEDRRQWWAPGSSACFTCGGIVPLTEVSVMWLGADGHAIILHSACAGRFASNLWRDAKAASREAESWERSCPEHTTPTDWPLCPRRDVRSYLGWLLVQDAEQLGGMLRPRLQRAADGRDTGDDRLTAALIGVVLGIRETAVPA